MRKSKLEFISELLDNHSIPPKHRERFLRLASAELKRNDGKVWKEIRELKKSFKKNKEPESSYESNELPDYKSPQGTTSFLRDFNQDIILKSTTHRIDENLSSLLLKEMEIMKYEYDVHREYIKKRYEQLKKKKMGLTGLFGKLDVFLLNRGNKGWSEDNIKVGWSSPSLKKWCEENPGKYPNSDNDLDYYGFELEETLNLKSGKEATTFNEVISILKLQIEFRDEANVKNIVKISNREIEKDYDCDFNTDDINDGIQFYSDVEKFKQAYKKIIEKIINEHNKHNKDKPIFELSLNEDIERDQIKFNIHHINSTFGKSLGSTIDRFGNDFTGLINKQLNGLCDMKIVAEFPNEEYAEVTIWPWYKNKESRYEKLPKSFNGVKFQLIFYR